jgi:hypothetical protein
MRLYAVTAFVWLFATPVIAATDGRTASLKPATDVVADIGGRKITRSEFEQKNALRLFQARNTYYESERKALEEYVDQQLLEDQARRENLSVDALLDKYVNSKLAKDPSDESLRVYYEGIDTTEPFEAVRGKIVEHLRQRRMSKVRGEYLKELRAKANISLSLSTPRSQVTLINAPVLGDG